MEPRRKPPARSQGPAPARAPCQRRRSNPCPTMLPHRKMRETGVWHMRVQVRAISRRGQGGQWPTVGLAPSPVPHHRTLSPTHSNTTHLRQQAVGSKGDCTQHTLAQCCNPCWAVALRPQHHRALAPGSNRPRTSPWKGPSPGLQVGSAHVQPSLAPIPTRSAAPIRMCQVRVAHGHLHTRQSPLPARQDPSTCTAFAALLPKPSQQRMSAR